MWILIKKKSGIFRRLISLSGCNLVRLGWIYGDRRALAKVCALQIDTYIFFLTEFSISLRGTAPRKQPHNGHCASSSETHLWHLRLIGWAIVKEMETQSEFPTFKGRIWSSAGGEIYFSGADDHVENRASINYLSNPCAGTALTCEDRVTSRTLALHHDRLQISNESAWLSIDFHT